LPRQVIHVCFPFPDINECASGPCENGATCNDHVNMYTCSCAPGWQGTHCELGRKYYVGQLS